MSEDEVIPIPAMTSKLAKEAAALANRKLRDTFLADDAPYVQRLGLNESALRTMRKRWNPIEPRVVTNNKIAMQMRTSDVARMTFAEKQSVQPIVMECAMQTIKRNKRGFISAILHDAVSSDPDLKYG